MALTIHGGVNTSPWSATRCLDLTRFMLGEGGVGREGLKQFNRIDALNLSNK
jgi:hypothetical protein